MADGVVAVAFSPVVSTAANKYLLHILTEISMECVDRAPQKINTVNYFIN